MRDLTKSAMLVLAGFAAAATTATADDPNAKNAPGRNAARDTKMLAGHGLAMIIDGSGLRGAAEELSGQPGQPGQPQPQPQPGQPQAGQDANPSRLLMMHARKEIQEGQRLLKEAEADGCDASCQRLFNAACRYAEALCAMCGESAEKDKGASADRGSMGDFKPTAQDKAAIILINHAVKEAVIGDHMRRALAHMSGDNSQAHEQLQKHAQEMATEGRDILDRFISSRTQSGNNPGGQPQGAAGPMKSNPVTTLAVRGREVIEAWNASSGNAGQPTASK